MKSIGQVAYEAWSARVPQPPWFDWNRLPKPAKDAWEEIAKETVRHKLAQITQTVADK